MQASNFSYWKGWGKRRSKTKTSLGSDRSLSYFLSVWHQKAADPLCAIWPLVSVKCKEPDPFVDLWWGPPTASGFITNCQGLWTQGTLLLGASVTVLAAIPRMSLDRSSGQSKQKEKKILTHSVSEGAIYVGVRGWGSFSFAKAARKQIIIIAYSHLVFPF